MLRWRDGSGCEGGGGGEEEGGGRSAGGRGSGGWGGEIVPMGLCRAFE
jgi:hypothetical protein